MEHKFFGTFFVLLHSEKFQFINFAIKNNYKTN